MINDPGGTHTTVYHSSSPGTASSTTSPPLSLVGSPSTFPSVSPVISSALSSVISSVTSSVVSSVGFGASVIVSVATAMTAPLQKGISKWC
ncbi:hypothetical protein [Actinophytocola glycyrrhizae]|uniref:Uncharacterized protein n=1 Tax=Actinophytocola glycyrrhizae TaxID=2044873 RepID=A0ABV9SBZ3_9PSEU